MQTGCASPSRATDGEGHRFGGRLGGRRLVVGYAIGTRQVFNDYYGGWGPGWGVGWGVGYRLGRGRYGGWGYDGPWVEDETRIAIDIFDARAHKAIWHGAVSQNASDLRGADAEAKINAAATAIFAKLPIGTSAAADPPAAIPPASPAPAPPGAAPGESLKGLPSRCSAPRGGLMHEQVIQRGERRGLRPSTNRANRCSEPLQELRVVYPG